MVDIPLVCSDLDGTLLNARGEISSANVAALKRLAAAGTHIALCSGRGEDSLLDLSQRQLGIDTYKICLDGAMVVSKDGTVIDQSFIDYPVLEQVVAIAIQYQVILSFATTGKAIVVVPGHQFGSLDDHELHVEIGSVDDLRQVAALMPIEAMKIGMNIADEAKFDAVYVALERLSLHVMMADVGFIEATAIGVTKFSALQKLAAYCDLPIAQTVAFGDYENDYEMIRDVGYGVAMGNATDHIKSVAKAVTETNVEDGVAKMLARLSASDQIGE